MTICEKISREIVEKAVHVEPATVLCASWARITLDSHLDYSLGWSGSFHGGSHDTFYRYYLHGEAS